MSVLNSILGLFGYETTDEYEDDDEYYEEEKKAPPRRNVMNLKKEEEEEEEKKSIFSRSKITSVPQRRSLGIQVMRPSSVSDATMIVDHILNGTTVVLNMEGLRIEISQRIIDFCMGSTHSIGGQVKRISTGMYIVTPNAVDLDGDFQDIINSMATVGDSIPSYNPYMN